MADLLERAIAIHRRATGEDEYEAIWPVLDEAAAFGRRALDTALSLLGSEDASARAVACDLLGTLCNPDEDHLGPEVASAIGRLAEVEADWATFGLGSQTEIDRPEVREALLRRVDDPFPDAQQEAVLGLARRRDPRALPLVERDLSADDVGRLPVEAAAYLADARLLLPLRSLRDWWDLDPPLLEEALAACDPTRRARDPRQ